jgi:hypothetical protein
MPRMQSLFVIFLAAALSLLSEPAQGEKTRGAGALFLPKPVRVDNARIALVIGNGDYGSGAHSKQPFGPLENPPNDARMISGSLRDVGFEVATHFDLDQESMVRAVKEFSLRLKEGGREAVGVFYYAGHGIQVDGQNYMIPVGSDIRSENDIRVKAVKVSSVLKEVASAENKMNLFILDACRNKPSTNDPRLQTQGFEKMDAPAGSMVAFATGSGELSQDGPSGGNSPYSKALAEYISLPGLTVEEVFKNTRVRVMAKTKKRQIPREDSSLTSQFYFVPPEIGDKAKPANSTEKLHGTVRVWPLGEKPRYASPEEVEVFFDFDEGVEGPLTVTPDAKGTWLAQFKTTTDSNVTKGVKVFSRWLPEDGPRFDPEKEGESIQFPHTESVGINLYQFERLSNRFRLFGERSYRKIKEKYPCAKRGEEGLTAASKCWNKKKNQEHLHEAQLEAQKAIKFYEQAVEFDSNRKNSAFWQMANIENSVGRSCEAFERLKSIDVEEWKTRLKKRQLVPVYSADALFNCLRTTSRDDGYLKEIRKGLRYLNPYFSEKSPLKDKNLRERLIGNWLEIFRLVTTQSSDDRKVANAIWKNGLISHWMVFTKIVDDHFVGITFPEIVDSPPIIEAQLFRIRNKLGW